MRGFSIAWIAIAVLPALAHAKPLQIIHTNDLHSHLEHAADPNRGGYARVKTTIDELKARAAAQGIETLLLDAGDFSEGSQFYLAEDGRVPWKMLNTLQYDAVVIGNHDWLAGSMQTDQIVGDVMPFFSLVGANFVVDPKFRNLRKSLAPYARFLKAGLRISVLGLTTDEFVYRWRVQDGTVKDPVETAKKYLPDLRKRSDLVISLTHIGLQKDIEIAQKVAGLDLTVGGHSHTELHEPVVVRDPKGRMVPIVQAGEHGKFVGDLLVDVEPGKALQILRYRLVPVTTETPQHDETAEQVRLARATLEKRMGAEWLYGVVGVSNIPLMRPLYSGTRWGDIVGEAIRDAVGAEISFNVGEFYGENQEPGEITRERVIKFFPRVFDTTRKHGWTIWNAKVPGWLLIAAVKVAHSRNRYFVTTGLTYDVVPKDGKTELTNFRVNGEKIERDRVYRMAVPEGLGLGMDEVSVLLRAFFRPKDSGISIWQAIEDRLAAMGGVVSE